MKGIRVFEIILLIVGSLFTFFLILVIWGITAKKCEACQTRSWFHGPIKNWKCKWCREDPETGNKKKYE
ncbi:MAG: hypothetical protein MRERV_14c005 [Mycoplasmataceae bacterium RV_VA103A]|nr:MAG: hypothetical protein MRERV_14c005 [Mycoplasmataceae bacterium RV_VA103A]